MATLQQAAYKREWARQWRQKNPELARKKYRKDYLRRSSKAIEYAKRYRERNSEKIKAYQQRYRKTNAARRRANELARKRRRENPERFREYVRLHRTKNTERYRRRAREYYYKHRDRIRELAKKRYNEVMADPSRRETLRQKARDRYLKSKTKVNRRGYRKKTSWILSQLVKMARDDGLYELLEREYENGK